MVTALLLYLSGCAYIGGGPRDFADDSERSEPTDSDPPTGDTDTDDPPTDTDDDADGDGFVAPEDCDDNDASVHPGAPEECDEIDHDCDGLTGLEDGDGDGQPWCSDCDDTEPLNSDDGEERCDAIDNDCDGAVDEDCTRIEDALGGVVLTGTSGDMAGISVDTGRDLTGDGGPDIVVGYIDGTDVLSGGVYVVGYDAAGGTLPSLGITIDDDQDWSYTGLTVQSLVDGTGDGAADLLVGSPFRVLDAGDGSTGVAYLFAGPITASLTVEDHDLALGNADLNGLNGYSLAGDVDVTGDGLAEVAVAAPGSIVENDSPGTVLLYSTRLDGGSLDPLTLSGVENDELFGDVVEMSDLNGDGVGEVLVVSRYSSEQHANGGGVYVFAGPIDGDRVRDDADASWLGTKTGWAGQALAADGDGDGDGYNDVLLGRAGDGLAWVVPGGESIPTGIESVSVLFSGAVSDDLGSSVAWAQLNDSAGHDVVIGAPGADDNAGAVFVWYDAIAGVMQADDAPVRLLGPESDAMAGTSLAAGTDLDIDGHTDVLVGAQGADAGGTDAGAVFVLSGADW